MIQTILFDLDGTLLPIEAEDFEQAYMSSLARYCKDLIEPEQLILDVWTATKTMIADTGPKSNEEVFYSAFKRIVPETLFPVLEARINAFYEDPLGFDQVRKVVGSPDPMPEALQLMHAAGLRLIIATNPMFPRLAINKRITWAGLDRTLFSDITYFETSHACKPNLAYYEELIERNQLDPSTCLMVGNDVQEDLVVRQLGMRTCLIRDNMIDRLNEPFASEWTIQRAHFFEFAKILIKNKNEA